MSESVFLREGEVHLAPLVHTIDGATARLGLSRRKFDALIKGKSIRVIRIGTRALIAESELQRFVAHALESAA